MDGKHISLWMDQLSGSLTPRSRLEQDLDVDVAIVGAGYTGLWTAYYLKRQAPQLRIVVLESEIAGFGASGRNGGWLMGNLLGEDRFLAGLDPARRHATASLLHAIPDEVAQVTRSEGIDCDLRKGGVLYCAARYPEQRRKLQEQLKELRALGHGEEDYRWLEPAELSAQLRVQGALGALYSPHCATIQPAKLVRGLAQTVERMGVTLYERSPVRDWQPGLVRTDFGQVRAQWVVPAVEGYAASLAPLGHYQLPVQSLMVATEPLPAELWAQIGLEQGQAFSEASRQVTYGQRSSDDRLVFGARGGYRFAGRLREDFTLTERERGLRRYLFGELFPMLKDVALTHAWGGNLGMARRFQPHMLRDSSRQLALAGGFGGEGVGATNLAGRTLAALILQQDNELTRQPWVRPHANLTDLARWEPEPLRWLGYNLIINSFVYEDQVLANAHSAPWKRRVTQKVAGLLEGLMR